MSNPATSFWLYQAFRARMAHPDAVHDITVELEMPIEKVEAGLAALEAQPRVIRELLMRQIAEAWLERQRRAHKRRGP